MSLRRNSLGSFWSRFRREAGPSKSLGIRGRRDTRPLEVEGLEERLSPNIAPVLIVPPGPYNVVKTTSFDLPVTATDKDAGEVLTFSLTGAPTGASITSVQDVTSKGSAAHGDLTWTPTEDQGPASYTFTITVTDNGKPVKSASQQITVATLAAGLVDRVVPTGEGPAAARELADRMLARGPAAIQVAKQMIALAEGEERDGAIESIAGALIATTADLAEGVGAFRAKRAATFEDR